MRIERDFRDRNRAPFGSTTVTATSLGSDADRRPFWRSESRSLGSRVRFWTPKTWPRSGRAGFRSREARAQPPRSRGWRPASRGREAPAPVAPRRRRLSESNRVALASWYRCPVSPRGSAVPAARRASTLRPAWQSRRGERSLGHRGCPPRDMAPTEYGIANRSRHQVRRGISDLSDACQAARFLLWEESTTANICCQ